MKPIKSIFLTSLLTLAAFTALTYSSCKKDPCKDVTCQNGGTCNNGSCICPTGYEGDKCQTANGEKFFGAWTGIFTCNNEPGEDPVTIALTSGATPSEVIWVSYDGKLKGTLTDPNTVVFPKQAPDPEYPEDVVGATVTLNGSTLQVTATSEYEYNGQTEIENCTGTMTK